MAWRKSSKEQLINWLIDFSNMSTHWRLFYAKRLGNLVQCTFILIFLCICFLRGFFLQQGKIMKNVWEVIKKYWDWSIIYPVSGNPCGVMAKVLNSCFEVSKFKLRSHYYIHFWTFIFGENIEPPYPLSYE